VPDENAVNHDHRWRTATYLVIAIWVIFMIRLMIADVWDETNGMLAFSSAAMSLGEKLRFVLTQSLGFWRPLPTLLIATVLHFVPDFDASWRILRGINIALIVAPVLVLVDTTEAKGALRFAMTVALLFSGSAVIAAGWYANMFDASALLLIAIALHLLLRGRAVAAGVLLGIAFFCKETTALALPFLLMLLAAGRITFRQSLRTGIPAAILGAIYFALRAKIVPFGSAGDVHGFAASELLPTIGNLAESFWRQSLKGSGPGILGFLFLAVSLIALRRPRLIAAAFAFLGATVVIYWGMFGLWQDGTLIHHLNFVGRLYLVPVALMLFMLALERRTLVIAVLCLPILYGGFTTWRDHARFQRMYKRIYRTAHDAGEKPLVLHFPTKPLDDTVRGVKIGDYPAAAVIVNAKTGRLEYVTR
jgi:Glycosyltransferase family 87